MTSKKIHVVPDTVRSEGGFAVIRLDGVWLLQDKATVRIRPLGDQGSLNLDGWPSLEQVPIDVRTTSRGIELVVGPEVVDAEALQPGRKVGISIPAADVSGEVIWPDIPRSRKPQAATVSGSKKPVGLALSAKSAKVGPVIAGLAKAGPASGAVDGSSTSNGLATLQLEKYDAVFRNGAHKASAAAEQMTPLKRQGLSFSASAKADVSTLPPATAKTPEQKFTLLNPASLGSGNALPPTPTIQLTRFSPFGLFAAGLLATGVILAFAWLNVNTDVRPQNDLSLAEIFAIGDISPRGIDARRFDRDDALLLANQFVHGIERETDKMEGAYWLRKALSLKLSNEQMTWALTQLGTIYANAAPGTTPDYRSAKMLWELAGANGDPVSLCFLGRLHEAGLGVRASLEKARSNYERARSLGGCPGLEAALVRVGK